MQQTRGRVGCSHQPELDLHGGGEMGEMGEMGGQQSGIDPAGV